MIVAILAMPSNARIVEVKTIGTWTKNWRLKIPKLCFLAVDLKAVRKLKKD